MEAMAGAAACGAAAGAATDSVLYGLDSWKSQLQSRQGQVDTRRLFRGVGAMAIFGSAPAFGVFFGLYAPLKALASDAGASPAMAVAAASATAAVPSSLIAVPADVVKKRLQLGLAETPAGAVRQVLRERGGSIRGLFIGYQANLMKDVPFSAFKLSLYEGLTRAYLHVRPRPEGEATAWEASGIGVASGMVTAVITNPLDVVNTRVKSAQGYGGASRGVTCQSDISLWALSKHVVRTEGAAVLMKGLGPRLGMIGVGSGLFWGIHGLAKDVYKAAREAALDHGLDGDADGFPFSRRAGRRLPLRTRAPPLPRPPPPYP